MPQLVEPSPEVNEESDAPPLTSPPPAKKTVRVVKKKVVRKMVTRRVEKGLVGSSTTQSEAKPSPNSDPAVSAAMEGVVVSGLAEEVENPKPPLDGVVISGLDHEIEKPSPPISVTMEGVAVLGSADEVEKPNPNPKILSKAAAVIPTEGLVSTLVEDTIENPRISAMEDVNVDSIKDQKGESENENMNPQGEMKEEVENCDGGGTKEVAEVEDSMAVLSEEMEALERQKRRKTEIFIGGLDKSAREEDIRKVFEEVGEVLEVRLMMNSKTGKNKGYAFLRFALASDAKRALAKYPKIEICGKQCGTAPVEGNDTIFLGNIDKNWKNEDVVKLLQEIGIDKIDKVTVMVDPSNIERNRGFAFLELETNKDAQLAYKKLQKKDVFGKHQNIKVAWAEPLNEPDEDEMLKVKTVYAEYIPSSWEEEKVRDCFKKFGEIESVVLARNLRSSKRKDFAFVKYTTREAALECIESFSREPLHDAECKVKVKVSLAKPIPKGKQIKRVSDPLSKDISNQKPKATKRDIKPNNPRNKGKSIGNTYEEKNVVGRSSTNAELVQLLREQASWRQPQRGLGGASVNLEYPYSLPGSKRPYVALGDDPLYSDPRVRPRTHLESSFPVASPGYTAISQGVGMTSLSYHERQGARYTSGYAYLDLPTGFQREGASYHGSNGLYGRY